jgi:VWFA-related protein
MPASAAIRRYSFVGIVCLVLLAVSAVGQQSKQQPPAQVPPAVLRATTQLVMLDVVVRDRHGNPVTDLTDGDFLVLEDGRQQQVAVFSLEMPAGQRGAELALAAASLPTGIHTNRPEYNHPANPLALLLLDGLNTQVTDLAYARLQVLRHLDTHHVPGQRMAVLALGLRLYLLQDFTDDRDLLRAAVDRYLTRRGFAGSLAGSTEMIAASDPAAATVTAPGAPPVGDLDVGVRGVGPKERARITLQALQAIARATAGYSGRKNLIWISAAFPVYLPSGEVLAAADEDIRRTTNLLSAAQLAVYPVDGRGLEPFSLVDVSAPPRMMSDAVEPVPRDFGPALAEQLQARATNKFYRQATMKTIAENTGGRAFYDSNDLDAAVREALADGSTYYLLGYYPENKKMDGRFRTIRVRVNRPGVEVRHRRGYFALDPADWRGSREDREQELEAAVADPLPANLVTFFARVPPPEPADPAEVQFHFLVDTAALTFEPAGAGRQSFDLDFVAVAFEPDGTIAASRRATYASTLTPERHALAARTGFPFQMNLQLKPGRYRVRLVVRDNRTGWLGSLDVPLQVPVPEHQ